MLLTADDLERMPDDDSVQIELDEGELITTPLGSEEHGYIEGNIIGIVANFVKEHRLGRVYPGDTGFRLSHNTVRSPDVAFVRKSRVAEVHGKGFGRGAPDLAVEILPPTDTVRQLMRKIRQYFAAGCQTVWIVDPDLREVEILDAEGKSTTLRADDVLQSRDLLPGFSVAIADLFGSEID